MCRPSERRPEIQALAWEPLQLCPQSVPGPMAAPAVLTKPPASPAWSATAAILGLCSTLWLVLGPLERVLGLRRGGHRGYGPCWIGRRRALRSRRGPVAGRGACLIQGWRCFLGYSPHSKLMLLLPKVSHFAELPHPPTPAPHPLALEHSD